MKDEGNVADYMASLNRARRRRRNRPPYGKYALAAAVVCVAAAGIFFGGKAVKGYMDKKPAAATETSGEGETGPEAGTLDESALAAEEASRQARDAERLANAQAVVDSYANIGVVQVSGYLNMRKKPESGSQVVGKLMDGSACEVQETLDGWYHVNSGGIDGYVSSEYVITGDAAKEKALSMVTDRAVVTTDNLNIREQPSTDSNIVGQCLEGERYEILGEEDGWYQIDGGYISSEFAEKRFSLNEARKLDVRAMVLNYYDNPGVSNVTNYLNIRQGAGKDEKVIGKLPSYAGCEILEDTGNGWYKIRSGNITGYVSSEFILTGDAARQAAMEHAELMAIVSTDRLNARTEPSTDAKIWTQISKEERYNVVSQLDGWVEIELDTGDGDSGESADNAYISTRDNNVEVRYALNEAIKFSPLEEKANQSASLRSQVVNYALQFVGGRYVWGGNDPHTGADCSGFVRYVLSHVAGVGLPRTSREQAKAGRSIKSSEMRPGDLIFYTNSKGTVNHVAMYIGNGQIVHAASRRSGIKISTWNYRTPKTIRSFLD